MNKYHVSYGTRNNTRQYEKTSRWTLWKQLQCSKVLGWRLGKVHELKHHDKYYLLNISLVFL